MMSDTPLVEVIDLRAAADTLGQEKALFPFAEAIRKFIWTSSIKNDLDTAYRRLQTATSVCNQELNASRASIRKTQMESNSDMIESLLDSSICHYYRATVRHPTSQHDASVADCYDEVTKVRHARVLSAIDMSNDLMKHPSHFPCATIARESAWMTPPTYHGSLIFYDGRQRANRYSLIADLGGVVPFASAATLPHLKAATDAVYLMIAQITANEPGFTEMLRRRFGKQCPHPNDPSDAVHAVH